MNSLPFISKLPQQPTSIFAHMSALAKEHHAINLSQGFPDFPMSETLIRLATDAMLQGHNQYAPMPGLPELRQRIAEKVGLLYQQYPNYCEEITITPGATCAIYTAINCCIHPGDEVIIFEPAYDSYVPAILASGGIPVGISLKHPDYRIDWDEVRHKITLRTRLLLLNNPHNPSATVLDQDDITALKSLLSHAGLLFLSDEVYEHLVYDGRNHESLLKYPELYARSFVTFSFGKLFHNTGWKIGYCIAPPALTKEFRKLYQFICFSTHTPSQYALAAYLESDSVYRQLTPFFQQKRDYFLAAMLNSHFRLLPCEGSYFMLADYTAISDEPDLVFAQRVTREFGVATIPLSPFYRDGTDHHVVRFCFAKKEETLAEAAERLCQI